MSSVGSPYQSTPAHSRSSSGASSASSPITSTFSNRSHNRWPSSSSSLATSPDSPVNVTKSALHDLVEDPAGEDAMQELPDGSADEPLCICDTVLCEHRQHPNFAQSPPHAPSTPEWTPGDDLISDVELSGERSFKRRKSGEYVNDTLTSRLSRRWPSISQRWKDHKPTTSVSIPVVRSAPASRSSSMRLPSLRRSLATHLEPASSVTPPYIPAESQPEESVLSRPRAMSRPQRPQDILIPEPVLDPIDRQELSSTPLLPPVMAEHLSRPSTGLQSPLQSPTIAELTAPSSVRNTPNQTPVFGGMPTPPLSSKPSTASFNMARSGLASSEVPPMDISEEPDYWAIKLGHANFHITPEPYFPVKCSLRTCNRLREDWLCAKAEYKRVATRVEDHYGLTSQTYKSTEQKWAEVDAQWQSYHERATAEAAASGETTRYHPSSRAPSLNDAPLPSKFPAIADSEIVGPMVQYATIQRQSSRKPTILKLFTDPASLLGGRSPFGFRR